MNPFLLKVPKIDFSALGGGHTLPRWIQPTFWTTYLEPGACTGFGKRGGPDMLNLKKVRVTVVKGGGPASRFSKGAGSSPQKSLIFIKKSSHQRRRGGVLTPWTHPLYAPLQEPCYALTTYECNTFKLLLLTVL